MSSTLSIKIGGTTVSVIDSSLQVVTRVDDKDRCTFKVHDTSGTAVFQKGQKVTVSDTSIGTLFTGFVNKPIATKLFPSPDQLWTIDCVSQFYHVTKHASKKRYKKRSGSGYAAGAILADQIQRYLAPDGVTGNFSLSWSEQQNEWSNASLSNTTAATNATNGNPSGGNLELAPAGTPVRVTGAAGSKPLVNALQVSGYSNQTGNNAATNSIAFTIWTGSQSIANVLDFFEYQVWVRSDSPAIVGAVDFVCSDGTTFRTSGATDTIGVSCAPKTDLSGLANNQWYGRQFFMPAGLVGKTISQVNVMLETTANGQFNVWFQSIDYNVHNGGVTTFFGTGSTLAAGITVASSNFSNVSVSTVQAAQFTTDTVMHSSVSISAASIVQASQIAWSQVVPTGCNIIVETSIDNQASWQVATSGNAIPNLLPGMSVSGRVVYYRHTLTLGNDPTAAVSLVANAPVITVNQAYVATKSDSITSFTSQSDFNTGTATNTAWSANGLGWTLNGFQQIWAFNPAILVSNQTTYGTGTVAMKNRILTLTNTNNELRSQLNFAGTWANFTAEIDITIGPDANVKPGLVYRTTGWQNNDGTFAYAVQLATTTLKLLRGTNSNTGAGSTTTISTVTVNFAANSTHRLKIVANGSTHTISVDGIQYISATDATFTAAGYLGLRLSNSDVTSQSAMFENFGVCAALTGTWQSSSISISGPGTYGNSAIMWDIDQIPNTTLISVQTSIDAGSTWQNVVNGGAISGLTAGQSLAAKTLLLKVTFTAQNAPVVPTLNGITAWVLGSYSSSGTRSNAPVGNDFFIRLNQAGSWGNSTDNQPWTRAAGTDTPSISSNKGLITSASSASATRMLLGTGTAADCEGLVRLTIGATADTTGIILRSDATAANHYAARTNGTTQIVISKRVSGTLSTLTTLTSGITIANGSIVWLRFRAQGTTLSAKLWFDGTSEPASFAGSTTDSSFASGQIGLYCGAAPTTPEGFDHFRVTLYPDPTLYLTSAGRATSSLVDHNSLLPANTAVTIQTSTDGGATYQTATVGGGIPGVATLLSSTATLQRTPAAFYRLDDTGSSAADSSGNGRTGTLNGTITKSVAGALQGPGESTDTAMTFDGSTGYIALPTGIVPTSHDFSIALWVKVNSFAVDGGGLQRRILINNIDGTNAFQLCTQAVDTSFIWACNDSTGQVISSHPGFSTGVWYHIVATWISATRTTTLYVNATAYPGNDSGASGFGLGTTTGFNIARRPDSIGYFPGTLDEVTVFTTALSAADATALYNAGAVAVGQTIDDTFTSDTHTNYTQTFGSGGASATWTWDTANSRVIAVGGTKAQLLYNNLWAYDVALMADFTQSQNSGLIWGWQNSSNYYTLVVCDSAGSTPNTLTVYKVSGGTTTQLASGAISFTPGSYHRVNVSMLAGVIIASFDNVQILTYTDASPFPAGQCGLRNDTGTSYIYELQIQPQAPDVSGLAVYTKHTLSSTDPTATPQLLDAQTMASDSTFGNGGTIAAAEYNQTYISDNADDLNTQSNYSYSIDFNKNITFTARQAKNAPWILQSSDVFVANATVEYSGDLYRNRQTLRGVYQTAVYTEIKQGDGSTRTWNVVNPITQAPTIVLNGIPATIGVQNVDTGRQFYWQLNSTSITQDNSQPLLQKGLDSFTVVYTGTSAIDFTVDNTGGFPGTISQSQMAALDGSTGVVESIEDVSQKNMNVAAATAYANQLLARYGNIARTITFTTLHAGLKPGHNLPIFIPELNIFDSYFLVVEVTTTARLLANGNIQYVYTCIASEAAALSSWVKFFSKILRSVK